MSNNKVKLFSKVFIGIFVVIFVIYLAVLLVFPNIFNTENFKNQFENEIKTQTGLIVDIESIGIKPAIVPDIKINAHHFVVFLPENEELIKVKDITLKVRVLPLLCKKIEITGIILDRPVISLKINNSGATNIDKYLSLNLNFQNSGSIFKMSSEIPDIELKRYKLKIFDNNYKEPFVFEGDKLNLIKEVKGLKIITKGELKQGNIRYIEYSTIFNNVNFDGNQTRLFTINPFKSIKQYNIKAKITSNIKIKENKDKNGKITKFTTGTADIKPLSFFINGKELNNNVVSLKFDNNKTEINTEIYTSLKDKLKLTGDITTGKNQNLNLQCTAENIELKSLKQIVSIILNAFNIKNETDSFDVSGKANLNFKVKSNFKTIQSQGFAELKNGRIKGKKLPYEISEINSFINFKDNTIDIEKAGLKLNGIPVNINGTINTNAEINITAQGEKLALEKLSALFNSREFNTNNKMEGIISFKSEINGTMKQPKTQTEINIQPFKIISEGITQVEAKNLKILLGGNIKNPDGKIFMEKALFLPKEYNQSLKTDKIYAEFNNNTIKIPKNTIKINNAPLEIEGTVADYQNEAKTNLNLSGKLSSETVYQIIKKEFPEVKAATSGAIGIKGTVNGNGNKLSVNADILADSKNYVSFIVIKELLNKASKTTINAEITKNDIKINKLSISEAGNNNEIISSKGTINGYNSQIPYLKEVSIVVPKSMTFGLVRLKNSAITVKTDLLLNGKITEPAIKGFLEVKDINIPEYKLESHTNEIIFDKEKIKINMQKLKIGSSLLDISADLNRKKQDKSVINNIKIISDYFDLDEINDIFSKTAEDPVYPGVEVPFDIIKGNASIKVFKTGGLEANDLKTEISLINNVLKMRNINGTAYKGSLYGQVDYNFLHTSTLSELNGKAVSIRPLFTAITGKEDNEVSGIADYYVKLNTIGTKQYQQQRTAKGYVEFTAKKGIMGPLGQFEHFLYAQNLISQSIIKTTLSGIRKAVKPKNTGLYTTAKGKIEIKDGKAYFMPITVEGPNMSLYIDGKVNILNDTADIKIYGRISSQIEKELGDLSKPMPKTIMVNPSETSIGNLFYDEYNTTVPQIFIDAIPELNPSFENSTSKLFRVEIQGEPDSVKAVKSFKWIIGSTNAPIPEQKDINNQIQRQEQSQGIKNLTQDEKNTVIEKREKTDIIKYQEQSAPEKSNSFGTPDFMDGLPDNFE